MKTVCVVFGGQSTEHGISCISAATIIDGIPKERYAVVTVGIAKNGDWFLYEGDAASLKNAQWETARGLTPVAFITHSAFPGLTVFREDGPQSVPVDVVIPVLHGKYGEDGTLQGLLDIAGIPYVGCGVLSSAACMDKAFTKLVVDTLGIRQAGYVLVRQGTGTAVEDGCDRAQARFGYPLFVKPCNAGSSYGVSKVNDRAALKSAVEAAFEHDTKVLIEQAIVGRELECAVLKKDKTVASGVGEIVTLSDFYSYEAKYVDDSSRTDTSPVLPDGVAERIRDASVRIFDALDGAGLARVDFFLESATDEVVFNEINTFPGFTSISMYPMLMEKAGYPLPVLIEELILSAFPRDFFVNA